MKLSCAFATSLETPAHVRIAEQLGYERAFLYDSPALYPDVWVQLCRAAELTDRIVLGPGVLIPNLRHPMVTASAVSTLVSIAGVDRVIVGIGSGFTGRLAMGQRPVPWAKVHQYARVVKALLRGEQVEWDGAVIQMLHPDQRFGAPLPIEVRWAVAAQGPRGLAVARELEAELFTILSPNADFASNLLITYGTVLKGGEDPGAERVLDAAGPGAALTLHWAVEHDEIEQLLPEQGKQWASAYDAVPENVRHLALHDRHMVAVNDYDRPFVSGGVVAAAGLARTPAQWREAFAEREADGCTEVVYQPAGRDIPHELEAMAEAFNGASD